MLVHTSMQDTNGLICFCHLCLQSVGFNESGRALFWHGLTVLPLDFGGEEHLECTADVFVSSSARNGHRFSLAGFPSCNLSTRGGA